MLNMPEAAVLNALQQQRHTNYAAELRRMEVEQRREMAAAARKEQEETAGITSPDKTSYQVSDDPDSSPSAETPENAAPKPSAQPTTANYPGYFTDQFERNIVRNIVRYGGLQFDFKWEDENGQIQKTPLRVIDYYNMALENDQIEFHHPLYARMLAMATEKAADAETPFTSDRFFVQHPDAEVNRLALDLLDDRYNALSNVENNIQLEVIVPRAMLELQDAIVRDNINTLNHQLRQPGADFRGIMQQINEMNEIRRYLAKELGERTVR